MEKFKDRLSVDQLMAEFDYNPETGEFTRRTKRAWNSMGSFGAKGVNGYTQLGVNGTQYLAHRLAWLYVHGKWPDKFIDHINGDKRDNRISNLREADSRTNNENKRKARSDNKSSGVLGVHWSEYHKKWKAHIRVNGKLKHLKYCASIDEAKEVYLAAKREMHAGCTI